MLQGSNPSRQPNNQEKENLVKCTQVYTPVRLLQRYSSLDIVSQENTTKKLNTPPQPIVPYQNPLNTYVFTQKSGSFMPASYVFGGCIIFENIYGVFYHDNRHIPVHITVFIVEWGVLRFSYFSFFRGGGVMSWTDWFFDLLSVLDVLIGGLIFLKFWGFYFCT